LESGIGVYVLEKPFWMMEGHHGLSLRFPGGRAPQDVNNDPGPMQHVING